MNEPNGTARDRVRPDLQGPARVLQDCETREVLRDPQGSERSRQSATPRVTHRSCGIRKTPQDSQTCRTQDSPCRDCRMSPSAHRVPSASHRVRDAHDVDAGPDPSALWATWRAAHGVDPTAVATAGAVPACDVLSPPTCPRPAPNAGCSSAQPTSGTWIIGVPCHVVATTHGPTSAPPTVDATAAQAPPYAPHHDPTPHHSPQRPCDRPHPRHAIGKRARLGMRNHLSTTWIANAVIRCGTTVFLDADCRGTPRPFAFLRPDLSPLSRPAAIRPGVHSSRGDRGDPSPSAQVGTCPTRPTIPEELHHP